MQTTNTYLSHPAMRFIVYPYSGNTNLVPCTLPPNRPAIQNRVLSYTFQEQQAHNYTLSNVYLHSNHSSQSYLQQLAIMDQRYVSTVPQALYYGIPYTPPVSQRPAQLTEMDDSFSTASASEAEDDSNEVEIVAVINRNGGISHNVVNHVESQSFYKSKQEKGVCNGNTSQEPLVNQTMSFDESHDLSLTDTASSMGSPLSQNSDSDSGMVPGECDMTPTTSQDARVDTARMVHLHPRKHFLRQYQIEQAEQENKGRPHRKLHSRPDSSAPRRSSRSRKLPDRLVM